MKNIPMARIIYPHTRKKKDDDIDGYYVDINMISQLTIRMPEIHGFLNDMLNIILKNDFYQLKESQQSLIINTLKEFSVLKKYDSTDDMEKPIKSEKASDFFEYLDPNS